VLRRAAVWTACWKSYRTKPGQRLKRLLTDGAGGTLAGATVMRIPPLSVGVRAAVFGPALLASPGGSLGTAASAQVRSG